MNFTDATIIYSRRRSISLVITDEAKLVVRAPHRFPQKYIHDFIISKNRWIANKIREVSSRPLPPVIAPEERERLKKDAAAKIAERCEYLANFTGLRPVKVRVGEARTQWGSCGAKGTININWKLILAPPAILDYVIIHELVHLSERNHSRRFWNKVAVILPDHKTRRQWIKKNNFLLKV